MRQPDRRADGMLGSVQLTTTAHEPVKTALVDAQRGVRIASPFLGPGPMTDLVTTAAMHPHVSWQLLTRLEANAVASGHLDLAGLRNAITAGVKVRTLPNLHAKVYLTDEGRFGFLGSGNFTGAGLGLSKAANVELGATLSESLAREAWHLFGGWWRASRIVTPRLLDEVEEAASHIPPRTSKPVPVRGRAANLVDAKKADDLLDEARGVGTWLKAVYFTLDPDDKWGSDGWFASSKRGRPSFQVGDLILIYAQNLATCNAVVEVTHTARQDPNFLRGAGAKKAERERWPWINEVRGRMTVHADAGVSLEDLGVNPQGLQGGHKRLNHTQFATAVQHLACVGSL